MLGEKSVAEYQDELNDRTDGGGCSETWEAIQAVREKEGTRRSVLKKTAAAAGMSVTALTGMVSAAEEAAEKVNVKQQQRESRRNILANALSDPEFKVIRSEFEERGYKQRVSEARVNTATIKQSEDSDTDLTAPTDREINYDESWDTVVIPFESKENEKDVHITWSSASTIDQHVAGTEVIRIVPDDGSEPYWEIETYTVNGNDEIERKYQELPNFLGCDDVNWDCVLIKAGTYSGTFFACGGCVATGGTNVWACGACVSMIITSAGTHMSCTWCN